MKVHRKNENTYYEIRINPQHAALSAAAEEEGV